MNCVFALVLLSCAFALGVEYYSDMYDGIDVDSILNSERLTNQYMACLLDKGPCTADGRSLKRILPDALATKCERCNDRQREIAKKVGRHMKEKRPETWTSFMEKYDPTGEYLIAFEEFLVDE